MVNRCVLLLFFCDRFCGPLRWRGEINGQIGLFPSNLTKLREEEGVTEADTDQFIKTPSKIRVRPVLASKKRAKSWLT